MKYVDLDPIISAGAKYSIYLQLSKYPKLKETVQLICANIVQAIKNLGIQFRGALKTLAKLIKPSVEIFHSIKMREKAMRIRQGIKHKTRGDG